jgi:hypothetical protein
MEALVRDEDSIREAIRVTVVRNLKVMARMGVFPGEGSAHALSRICRAHRRASLGGIFAAAFSRGCARSSTPMSPRHRRCGSAGHSNHKHDERGDGNSVTFLERIFENLRRAASQPVLQEARAEGIVSVTGAELLALTADARAFLRAAGLARGDRCAIVAPNSVRWVALDLALMAEGIVTVPLYARQAPAELGGECCAMRSQR